MEVTPHIPAGRQVIESYGGRRFRVSGVYHEGPILVFPDVTMAWGVVSFAEVTLEKLGAVIAHGGVEVLMFGTGRLMQPMPVALRQALKSVGIVADTMNTGAACRTYNVLLSEDRRVAAALLPLG